MALSTMAASASTGVMNSLLEKLNTLMGDEYRKLTGVQNKVASLRDELSSMNALLVEFAERDELDGQANVWRDQVREMSYDIEDCIDEFMHDLEEKGATTGFLNMIIEILTKLMLRYQIANQIQAIEARINQVNDRRKRFKLNEYTPSSSVVPVDRRALAIHVEASGLVGIDVPSDEVVELLRDQDQELKVVSIVGFGGLGKTTLAGHVLRKIRGQFDCHAFVSVSLKPDIQSLLQNLLSKLSAQQSSDNSKLNDVIFNIREYLLKKRYFIIVDDLWDKSAWEIIKYAFPQNSHGSRVLITTRISSVAAACCSESSQCVYKMKSLNAQDSERLFFSRIFGSGKPCPTELEVVSTDILKKCGGLPLAIISISSLLAGHPKSKFEHVRKSLGSMFEGNPTLEQMREILELSYKDLPHHHKTCLLYLGMYPEDYEVKRDFLLDLWMAEGFVSATSTLDAKDVAISYFNELVNRSMIQPVDTYVNGEVISCRVHDIMLDVIRSKIEEDNFIAVVHGPKVVLGMNRKIRRVSLQCHGAECRVTPAMVNGSLSKVRSVMVFGLFSCPSLSVLKYVRVLHLDIGNREVLDLTGMSGLFLLRLLRIKCSPRYEGLKPPSQIGKLCQLETFDLGQSMSELPPDIVSLPRLLHLIVHESTVFPNGISRLRSLRTVKYFDLWKNSVENIEGLGELTNLREFRFTWTGEDLVEGERRMIVLRSSLQKILGTLRYLSVQSCPDEYKLNGWMTFSPPPIHLEEMHLARGCVFSRIPKWIAHLRCLHSLSIEVKSAFKDDGVATLAGLPSLAYLCLGVRECPEGRVIIPGSGVAFQALTTLLLSCPQPLLTFEAGAMPRLQLLSLWFEQISGEHRGSAEDLVDGIEHLPAGLRKVELWISGEEKDRVATVKSCRGSAEDLVDGIEHLPAGLRKVELWISGEEKDRMAAVKSSLKTAFEEHHPDADLRFEW